MISQIFPITEFEALLAELPEGEELNESERTDIARMQDLILRKYAKF